MRSVDYIRASRGDSTCGGLPYLEMLGPNKEGLGAVIDVVKAIS